MSRKTTIIKNAFMNFQRSVFRSIPFSIELGLHKPVTVVIDITRRCNMQCRFCDIWKGKQDRDPSLSEIDLMINKLEAWLGDFQLSFLGGEPFLRRDISDILKISAEKGITTTFTTNGTMITRELADQLVSSGVYGINFSLDSISAEKHDALRGMKGTYDKVMKAIDYLRESKLAHSSQLQIGIASIICKDNIDDIPLLVDWAIENKLDNIWIAPINGNFDSSFNEDWYEDNELWIGPEDMSRLDDLIQRLKKIKKSNKIIINTINQMQAMKTYFSLKKFPFKKCLAGNSMIGIRVNGDMVLCPFMGPVGNLLSDDPKKIWMGDRAEIIRQEISDCKKTCGIAFCFYDKTFIEKVARFKAIIDSST